MTFLLLSNAERQAAFGEACARDLPEVPFATRWHCWPRWTLATCPVLSST